MIEKNYLELRKAELLERLNNWRTSGEEGEAMLNLIIKLVSGTAVSDPDFKAALEDDEERADYIKDHFDGLLYSNSTLVISW